MFPGRRNGNVIYIRCSPFGKGLYRVCYVYPGWRAPLDVARTKKENFVYMGYSRTEKGYCR